MQTYQDLLACGQNEGKRLDFCRLVINEHKASPAYRIAADAETYYAKRNVTISKLQKLLYDFQGRAHVDMFSANYKLKTSFFRRFVIQQVQYILANGITFTDPNTKAALGKDFENQFQMAAKWAMIDGVSFLFWNLDHAEAFGFVDTPIRPGFAPLHDDTTGGMLAGVRYWHVGESARFTLYEPDGYTEYIEEKGEIPQVLSPKRAYKIISRADPKARREGLPDTAYTFENYPGFPIIPLYANDLRESEIVGLQESIDCYDFIKSGFANEIDDTSGFYWVLKNAGGMDDTDLARFLDRMRKVRAAVIDADEGVEAEAHTLEIPVQAREAMLNRLETDLYKDAQIVNVSDLSAVSKTATEIRAAYQPMDDKTGDFEYCLRTCLSGILNLVGIEDTPTFEWNRIANQSEDIQNILLAAPFVPREYIVRKLLTILGDADLVEDILEELEAEDLGKFDEDKESGLEKDGGETPTTAEAIDAAEEAVGKTLNGSQTSSLITVIKGLKSGDITEGQAVRILTTSIGVTREEALAIIRGEE